MPYKFSVAARLHTITMRGGGLNKEPNIYNNYNYIGRIREISNYFEIFGVKTDPF